MHVRRAVPSDVPALARVHVRSWQAAYRGVFPSDWLEGLDPEERIPMWRRHLADRDLATLVAESEGTVIGFALIGPEGERASVGEVFAIYLDPEWWGRGAGRELLSAAEAEMAERGFTEAILWVLDRNDRARRFYEGAGWTADGVTKDEPVFGRQATEVRYRRSLS